LLAAYIPINGGATPALFDGAMAQRLVLGAEAPTTPVVAAAAVLIDAAGRPDPRRPPAPRRWGAGGAA